MSRIDPNNITVSTIGTQRFIVLPGSNTQCICISLIYVNDCNLIYGKPTGNTRVKKVGGVLHLQEMERLAACFCMQYDLVNELNANAFGWVLYFDTRTEAKRGGFSVFCLHTVLITIALESPTKPHIAAASVNAAVASFSFFPKYPGVVPRAQTLSPSKSAAGSPSKASSSWKPTRSIKSILDFADTGVKHVAPCMLFTE